MNMLTKCKILLGFLRTEKSTSNLFTQMYPKITIPATYTYKGLKNKREKKMYSAK